MTSPVTIRPIGDWARATETFADLPSRATTAARAALGLEAQRFRGEVRQGIQSGAPGGKKYAALSPLTLALHGAGKGVMRRSEQFLQQVVVVRNGNTVSVTVRGSRERVAGIHEEGKTFRRVLSVKQRRFLFAAMRAAGIAPRGGGGDGSFKDGAGRKRDSSGRFFSKEEQAARVGMTVIPARPTFGPAAAKYFRNQAAAERRILSDWQWMMGGKFKPR